jgi:hypothetical protein
LCRHVVLIFCKVNTQLVFFLQGFINIAQFLKRKKEEEKRKVPKEKRRRKKEKQLQLHLHFTWVILK